MDFKGQQFSENLYQYIMLLFSLVAFLAGFFTQSFRVTMIVFAGGLVLSFVLAVPDWPYFNQDPLPWLPNDDAQQELAEKMSDDGAREGSVGEEGDGDGTEAEALPAKKAK